MGDPKRSRRKFQQPSHPWQGDRIKREDEYVRKYGLKNKKEFWKAESLLRAQRAQAREYIPRVLRNDKQAEREADQLVGKLNRLGLLEQDAALDDVLALNVDGVLSRRLQTVAYMKGLASTPNQARQFIVHGHIAIGDRRVDVPGYLVTRDEESAIDFAPTSPLQNPAHPLHQEVPGTETAAEVAEQVAEDVEEALEEDAEEPEAEEEPDEEEAPEADEAEEEEEEAEEPEADEEPEEPEAEEADEEDAETPSEKAEPAADEEAPDEEAAEDAAAEDAAEEKTGGDEE